MFYDAINRTRLVKVGLKMFLFIGERVYNSPLFVAGCQGRHSAFSPAHKEGV